jgi:myosin-1
MRALSSLSSLSLYRTDNNNNNNNNNIRHGNSLGDVLISCNPFTRIDVYGADYIKLYASSASRHDSPPHSYALAEACYRQMQTDGSPQAVIISGESGAGKTECAKQVLTYIGAVSPGNTESIKAFIEQSNPLLESMGNAKTVRNDNSSRFGKYLEIQFEGGVPVNGDTMKFLLEQARVVTQGKDERNFHVFYQLMAGANDQMKKEFGLEGVPTQFHYTNQSGCFTRPNVSDAEEFLEMIEAMTVMGIDSTAQWYVFQVLSAILHLGNVVFKGETKAQITDDAEMQWAAYLLEVDQKVLTSVLLNRRITTGRRSAYEIPQNADQATSMRDALAKGLYSRLFNFIVEKVNVAMSKSTASKSENKAPPPKPAQSKFASMASKFNQPSGGPPPPPKKKSSWSGMGKKPKDCSIGVLDIYGFEVLPISSLFLQPPSRVLRCCAVTRLCWPTQQQQQKQQK